MAVRDEGSGEVTELAENPYPDTGQEHEVRNWQGECFAEGCKAQDPISQAVGAEKERERIMNWMGEPCLHTGGLDEQQMYKSDCPKCWQGLKEQILPPQAGKE